jgi:hypothetical protein
VNRDGIGRGDIAAPDQQRVTATRILIAESSNDIRDARVLAGNARLNRHQTVVSPAAHLGAFASP